MAVFRAIISRTARERTKNIVQVYRTFTALLPDAIHACAATLGMNIAHWLPNHRWAPAGLSLAWGIVFFCILRIRRAHEEAAASLKRCENLREALFDVRNRILCPAGPSPSLDDIQKIASAALQQDEQDNG